MSDSDECSNQLLEQSNQNPEFSSNQNEDVIEAGNNSDESDDESVASSDDEGDDVDDEDDTVCPICLGELTDQMVAIPENCMHMFCADCLQEWTKKVNTCPVDRKKFNSISILRNKDGTVLEEVHVEDREITEEGFEDPPTFCEVCGSCDWEESLLLCDDCDQGYHLDCLSPPLDSVPIDEWYCDNCRPAPINTYKPGRLRKNVEESDFIGSEDDMMQIYERTRTQSIDNQARSFLFGQVTGTKARTVASARGRNSRRRGAATRRRASSRSTSSGSQRRKKKPSKKRKGKSKNQSKKIQKSLGNAKKKMIKEQLRKFREQMSDIPCVSLYGQSHDLNEFYGDFEELNSSQVPKTPTRSTIVNTTDVVGSILGGFGTLNPDNLVVLQDGTLVRKQAKENDENIKNIKTEKCLADTNEKRRKIRFHEEESAENTQISNQTLKKTSETDNEFATTGSIFKNSEESHKNMESDTNSQNNPVLKELLKKKYLEKMSEKLKAKELDKRLKSMRTERRNEEPKLVSFQCVSNFKIPKLKNESNVDKAVSGKCVANNKPKTFEEININTLRKPIHEKTSTDIRKTWSLEQKIELHRKGKLGTNIKRSHATSTITSSNDMKSNSFMTKPLKSLSTSTTTTKACSKTESSKLSTDFNVKRLIPSSTKRTKENINVKKLSKTCNHTIGEKIEETATRKKSLSINDYKNRKLYEELFGDADLETDLKVPSKKKAKKVTFAHSSKPGRIQSDQLSFKESKRESNDDVMAYLKSDSNTLQKKIFNINKSISINTSPQYPNLTEIINCPISAKKNRNKARIINNTDSFKNEFWDNQKKDLPIAVVTPSPRLDNDDSSTKTYTPSNLFNEGERKIHSPLNDAADNISTCPGGSAIMYNQKSASFSMLKELNSSVDKAIDESSIISKIKSVLKPYYTQKIITKEMWKVIMKRVHKKVMYNVDFYMNSGRIENLIGQYVKRYLSD